MRALTLLTAGLLIAGAMAGYGSEDGRAAPSTEAVNYGSFGTRADIDCGDGKSLTVGGSNNTLTVTGRCSSVSVGGADNKITLEQVDDELSVAGLNNSITFRAGEPRVDDSGAGNRITQG
jgi:hypothetical protein